MPNESQEIPAVSQYREMLDKADKLRTGRVEELKRSISEAIQELKAFGTGFELREVPVPEPAQPLSSVGEMLDVIRGGKPQPHVPRERYCKICEMAGHDGKHHRGQEVKKKFTVKELKARGL